MHYSPDPILTLSFFGKGMNSLKHPLYLLVLLWFCFVYNGFALDDGVYLLKDGLPESPLRLPGGAPGQIDRILKNEEYSLSVVSQANDNDRFQVILRSKLPPSVTNVFYFAIALDGSLYSVAGPFFDSLRSLTSKPVSSKVSQEAATRIAAINGGTPILRKHIGQKLTLRFVADRRSYRNGDPIVVSVQVKNLGDAPITVGMEYGNNCRSSQLAIVPSEESAESCTDIRYKTTIASSVDKVTIDPGEVATIREENLRRWYKIGKLGLYHFIGIYKLRVYEREDDKYPCWIEHAASDFEFEYGEYGKR